MTKLEIKTDVEQALEKVQVAMAAMYEITEEKQPKNLGEEAYKKGVMDTLEYLVGFIDAVANGDLDNDKPEYKPEDKTEDHNEDNNKEKDMKEKDITVAFDYMFRTMQNLEKEMQNKYGKRNGTNLIAAFIESVYDNAVKKDNK